MADATIAGQIGLAITVIGFGVGVLYNQRAANATTEKARIEAEDRATRDADARDAKLMGQIDTIRSRVDRLDARVADFMPRSEIERGFSGEALARTASVEGVKMAQDTLVRDFADMRVSMGKVEQKQDGTAASLGEVKVMLQAMNGKLDKQGETLAGISRDAKAH